MTEATATAGARGRLADGRDEGLAPSGTAGQEPPAAVGTSLENKGGDPE
ncbi:hypothetical protein ACIQKE_02160 [Streptomyces griseoviridis]|nr:MULTISPECIES: hypothetical protein [Streptomyces]